MSPDAAVAARRPGRPRSDDRDEAIEAATLDLLVEQGYAGLSMEGVAARAGVGKATIYRRWESKLDLVLDAVIHRCYENVVSPDTGSLREDLLELFRAILVKFRRDGPVMRAFVAEQARHPDLARAFRDAFLSERRSVLREVLARAVARRELAADADVELLMDVGSGVLWYRFAVTGEPLSDDLPERIVDQFFEPLRSP
jgi:AcrR family transcriptional regulator